MGSLGGHFPIEVVPVGRLRGRIERTDRDPGYGELVAVMPGGVSQELERAQLERFRSDYILRFGATPFEGARRGRRPSRFRCAS